MSVYFRGSYSSAWKACQGVRQGGVTSAYLFCIYIIDILNEISKMPLYCKLGVEKMNIQAYADDIVIFCPSACGLRSILTRLESMLLEHGLVVNITKTRIIIFNKYKKK